MRTNEHQASFGRALGESLEEAKAQGKLEL
jgi:hypothetical protein